MQKARQGQDSQAISELAFEDRAVLVSRSSHNSRLRLGKVVPSPWEASGRVFLENLCKQETLQSC